MKFSIITPSFEQGQYIADNLESVLVGQSDCDVEHIVVDGGSTDDTVKILMEHQKIHPSLIWTSEKDQGQSDAINKGIGKSTGDILAYLNSDDYYLPGTLAKVNEIFHRYPNVDFVYGDIYMVDQNRERLRLIKSLKTSLWHHLYCFPFPQQSCFWRRDLMSKIPLFNTGNKTCMDSEFFACALTLPLTLHRISKPLACFRIHQDSISGSGKWSSQYRMDKLRIELEVDPERYLPRFLHLLTGKVIKQYTNLIRPYQETFVLSDLHSKKL
jgi:glycosyltransferase involved in cell wall biosynthesis